MPRKILQKKLLRFLDEDLGQGDITTSVVVPADQTVEAEVIIKEEGVVAGLEEALALCEGVNLEAKPLTYDGAPTETNTPVLQIKGNARTLLAVERTLLNLLSRMSGIATLTRHLVEKVKAAGANSHVASTRKVAPGLGYFDKKAVFLGGGDTHRMHLDDLVLIKDNHVKIAGNVEKAVKKARKGASFSKKVEVEVATTGDALRAVSAGADIIMLDNFSPDGIRETVSSLLKKGVRNKVLLEASGRITQENLLEYISAGVDIVSIGAITHSVKALDISLEIVGSLAS